MSLWLSLYFVCGLLSVWLWSIPHRRGEYPPVSTEAWILVGLLWPLGVVVWLIAFTRALKL